MVNTEAFERVVKDSEKVFDGWKSMFVTAATEVMVAEQLISTLPDDPGLRVKLTNAWKQYRGVCRSARKLNLPRDVIFAVPRLIFSQVIPTALAKAR